MERTALVYEQIIRRILIVLLILGATSALPSAGYAGSVAASHPVHAATPLQAVQIVLRPFDPRNHGKYNFTNCTTLSPRSHPNLTCPETLRLRHYLSVRRLPIGDSGLPFCRCQSGPYSVRVGAVRYNNGRVARVDVRWDFGRARSSPSQRMHSTKAMDTFVVLHEANIWLVDDEYCAGRPATSVYQGVTGESPCYRR